MQNIEPDCWRVASPRFCGTHTTDIETAQYFIDRGEAYPCYKIPDIPQVRGVSIDAESPNQCGILITFDRTPTDDEIRMIHQLLAGCK